MEAPLRFTLLADGVTDRCLVPVLAWVLRRAPGFSDRSIIPQFTDHGGGAGLPARIERALHDFPSDLLFVHRDAEREPMRARIAEVEGSIRRVESIRVPAVPVVPVRMTEAWLLFDEAAIRRAAGNPRGEAPLSLPRLEDLERVPDPKKVLRESLLGASELNRRRRDRLRRDLPQRIARVAELIDDFSPLDALPAFRELRRRTAEAVAAGRL